MRAAAYVGRVGGLAVALGVGAALVTGHGVAWADPSGTASSADSSSADSPTSAAPGSSVSHDDDVSSATDAASTADPVTPTSDTATSSGKAAADVPSGVVVSTGGAHTSSTGSDSAEDAPLEEPDTAVGDDARATTPISTEFRRSGGTSANDTGLAPSATNTTSARVGAVSRFDGAVAKINPIDQSGSDFAADVPSVNAFAAQTLSVPDVQRAAVTTATLLPAAEATVFDPVGTGLSLVSNIVSSLVSLVLSPFAAATPTTPAEPPTLWTLLAWVRREFFNCLTPAPMVLPAVQQWSAEVGTYTFTPTSRIVVAAADVATLSGTAQTLADDLAALTGSTVTVVHGQPAMPGDVLLARGPVPNGAPTADTRAEAYRLEIGSVLSIEGVTDTAVFNGTRTLLQLLHQSPSIGYGTAIDWPTYTQRGLLVDVGRKYVPLDWLRARIRDMAYLKMNYLHLHLSDNPGFRLESDSHPEITAPEHYTKQEMTDLIAYAARYHVMIVPDIDFPAHCAAILAQHPELQLVDDTGNVVPDMIDLSNPASYALIEDLLDEYLPLFPGKYWDIAADEYLADYSHYPQLLAYARANYGPDATAKDSFYGYINWANEIIRGAGKTARVANDELHPGDGTVAVDPNIVVDYWSADGPLQNPWLFGAAYTAPQLVAQGHLVANDAFTPTYYTTGLQGQLLTAPLFWMYDLWDPTVFVAGNRISDPSTNLGSMLSLWFDDPSVSLASATAGIHDRLRVMAQQTWGSPKPALLYYLGFSSLINTIGDAPASQL